MSFQKVGDAPPPSSPLLSGFPPETAANVVPVVVDPPTCPPPAPATPPAPANNGTASLQRGITPQSKVAGDSPLVTANEGMARLASWGLQAQAFRAAWDDYRAALSSPAALAVADAKLGAAAAAYGKEASWLLDNAAALQAALVLSVGPAAAAPWVRLIDDARATHVRVHFEHATRKMNAIEDKMGGTVDPEQAAKLVQLMDAPVWKDAAAHIDALRAQAVGWIAQTAMSGPRNADLAAYMKSSPALFTLQTKAIDVVVDHKVEAFKDYMPGLWKSLQKAAQGLDASLDVLHRLAPNNPQAQKLVAAVKNLQTLATHDLRNVDWSALAGAVAALEEANAGLNQALIPRVAA